MTRREKLDIETAVLECISSKLENGVDGDDPRGDGAGFYIYGGRVRERDGKVLFDTPTINDEGEYFEISCELKRRKR